MNVTLTFAWWGLGLGCLCRHCLECLSSGLADTHTFSIDFYFFFFFLSSRRLARWEEQETGQPRETLELKQYVPAPSWLCTEGLEPSGSVSMCRGSQVMLS